MSQQNRSNHTRGLFMTFVLPAFWIFVIPSISLGFFIHARSQYDEKIRTSIFAQIEADREMSPEEKVDAKALWQQTAIWKVVANPNAKDLFTADTKFHYFQFRWMIRLAILSIALSIVSILFVGLCVLISMRSQGVQYYSLLVSWYGLRMVGIFQTIVQGLMIFALSYWITAIWFHVISIKLIGLVGIVCAIAVFTVIAAFFKRIPKECNVNGFPLDASLAKTLWARLKHICDTLGTKPPDQVIAGIDNNFFVTEQKVIANQKKYDGRTLFISLPLLKQLSGPEADAVLAHEMAHFSGNDTIYSRKITPLLARYGNYLIALREGVATFPVFYFMNFFRALFELSLSKIGKEREFRADKLAAEIASPDDFASALLKIIAYSNYRDKVQADLFNQQEELDDLNIGERIESGFQDFSASFANETNLGELRSSHPFDSHPATSDRLEAIGIPLDTSKATSLLSKPSDGKWYFEIDRSDELERAQWEEFEEFFQKFHEQTLPYRYIPSNDREKEVVLRYFPDREFEEKKGKLAIDFEKILHSTWPAPIYYRDLVSTSINEGVLYLQHTVDGAKTKVTIKSSAYKKQANEMLGVFQAYYQRYRAAVEHQTAIKTEQTS